MRETSSGPVRGAERAGRPDGPGGAGGPGGDEHGQGEENRAGRQVIVVGPDGAPIGAIPAAATDSGDSPVHDMIEQPAKVMRIGAMIKQLLEEVRAAPLDDASRSRLRTIHQTSIKELCQGLAPELRDELNRITLPLAEDTVPSDAELRVAQAQLVGWLEGLFHGIQTALFAQQMAARVQLEEMRRRALPGPPGGMPTEDGSPFARPGGSGPYL